MSVPASYKVPAVGERVLLSGTVIGHCSIKPAPWITVRFDDGSTVSLNAPYEHVRVEPPSQPDPAGSSDGEL